MSDEFKVGDSIVFKSDWARDSRGGNRVVTAVGVSMILYEVSGEEFYANKKEVVVRKPFFKIGKTYGFIDGIQKYRVTDVREIKDSKFAWAESAGPSGETIMRTLNEVSFENMREVL